MFTSQTTYIRDSRPNQRALTFQSLDRIQNNLAYRASEKSRLGKVEDETLTKVIRNKEALLVDLLAIPPLLHPTLQNSCQLQFKKESLLSRLSQDQRRKMRRSFAAR